MAKQKKEDLEVEIVDFDADTAMLQFSKSDIYFSVSLTPEELQDLALELLDAKTKIEMINQKK